MKVNYHITKLELASNSIKTQSLVEVKEFCDRNIIYLEKQKLPNMKKEMINLLRDEVVLIQNDPDFSEMTT